RAFAISLAVMRVSIRKGRKQPFLRYPQPVGIDRNSAKIVSLQERSDEEIELSLTMTKGYFLPSSRKQIKGISSSRLFPCTERNWRSKHSCCEFSPEAIRSQYPTMWDQ